MFFILWLAAYTSFFMNHLLSIGSLFVVLYYKVVYPAPKNSSIAPLKQVVIAESSKMASVSKKSNHHQFGGHTFHSLLVACLIVASLLNTSQALEQDAQVLKPVTSLLRSIVSAITTGSPTPIEYSDAARNLVSLTWMRGFPATIPRTLPNKTMELYNRVSDRVFQVDIRRVTRKTLAELKTDMDAVFDAVDEQVRNSPDGIYTDYLQTRVNGEPLEEALVKLGTQLRAYGVDLSYYRDIAGTVLGLPLMPEVASTASVAASFVPDLSGVQGMTSSLINTGAQGAGTAIGAGIKLTNSTLNTIDNLIGLVPLPLPNTKTVTNPLSSLLFGSSSFFGGR